MVKLTFLGTGNAFGIGGRRPSSYLIEGSHTLLLDCGPSILPALRGKNKSFLDIDAILLSHLHPDHYLGIPQLIIENYYVLRREKPVPVYCPIGTKDKINEVASVLYSPEVADHVNQILIFHEFGINENREIPGGSVSTFEANHSDCARMQLIQMDDKKIGYTGDSAFLPESISKLLQGDIVITEASSSGYSIPHHTTLEELLTIDNPDQVPIYLTHMGQTILDKVDDIIPPLYLSHDDLEIEIK